MNATEKARFDARLSKEQKEFFEYAASLGGFRTLTDFVISSVQERAKEIVEEHNTILASKRDQELFFDAITKGQSPNDKLKEAALRFKNTIAK
jgi:uncharacterized protein (DUF1778 family)